MFLVNAGAVMVLFVLILVFVNLIFMEWPSRIDLTEEGIFTLDPLSRKIPSRFEDLVVVNYYATPDRFPATPKFETLARDVRDKLKEYAAHSEGMLRVEILDPREGKKDIDKEVREKMEAEGISPSHGTDFEDDKPIPREFYSSIKLNYAEKAQVIENVETIDNLEYRVTKALRALQVKRVPKVGFLFSGKEEGFGREGNYQAIQTVLRDFFLVQPVTLGEKDPVPDDIDVLFVPTPERIPPRHQFAIDQYLMNGRRIEVSKTDRLLTAKSEEGAKEFERTPGRVVFLMDVFDESRVINQQQQFNRDPIVSKIESGMTPMLGHWGIQVNSDLVLDLDLCVMIPMRKPKFVKGFGYVDAVERVQMPRIFLTKNENYSRELAFVNLLDKIVFVDPLSVAPADPLPEGVTFEPIIKTSKKAWRIDFANQAFIMVNNKDNPDKSVGDVHVDPKKRQADVNPDGVQYTLAGVWQGNFKSFFAGKKVPEPAKDATKGPEAGEPEPEEDPPGIVDKTVRSRALMKEGVVLEEKTLEDATSRIVVIGNAQVFRDFIIGRHQHKPNIDFLINLIEWLSTEESLSRIRSKGLKARPLEYDKDYKNIYVALLICGVPLLVLLIGGGVLVFRWADKVIWIKAHQDSRPREVTAPAPARESAEDGKDDSKPSGVESPEDVGPSSKNNEGE
jgi:ABC-type uncharacterized transport system involved in gliding motility auxiliary subunit